MMQDIADLGALLLHLVLESVEWLGSEKATE